MNADRPRFVVDTNVLVSATFFSSSMPRRAITVARTQGDLLLSAALLRELRDVFSRPKDDRVLEVAVNGGAACIVSGDDDLLVLDPFRGIPILSPASFVGRFP